MIYLKLGKSTDVETFHNPFLTCIQVSLLWDPSKTHRQCANWDSPITTYMKPRQQVEIPAYIIAQNEIMRSHQYLF